MKNVGILADSHCGHGVGLTPPKWQHQDLKSKICNVRRECWEFYRTQIKKYGPFDVLIVNGDMVEGKGEKSEGVELIAPDRNEQVEMAVECLKVAMTRQTKLIMTYGTPYHTGAGEDFELQIAHKLGGTIGNVAHVDIEGVMFEAKHHIGNSQVPHTRHTAISREHLWNILWAEKKVSPRADVLIRSHVHYYAGAFGDDWLGMTTPALQGFGSRLGARRMSGIVNFGFIVFNVDKGKYKWEPVLANVEAQRSTVIRVR